MLEVSMPEEDLPEPEEMVRWSYIWWLLHTPSVCLLLCSGPRFVMVPNGTC